MRRQRNGGRALTCNPVPRRWPRGGRGAGARGSPFVLGMQSAAHGGRPSARVAKDCPGRARRGWTALGFGKAAPHSAGAPSEVPAPACRVTGPHSALSVPAAYLSGSRWCSPPV